jgi:hypothetical protein
MGPQEPKDLARDTARDLSGLVGELAALKADATHWLTDPEYAALRNRLEAAHAAAEAALVEGAGVGCASMRSGGGREETRIANGLRVLNRGCAKAGRLM